jgi:hypothetical protein
MALVVELNNVDPGVTKRFNYPDEYEIKSHTGGVWLVVINGSETVAMHKSDQVTNAYRTTPKASVPVDTRLNHMLLKRGPDGRFVKRV